ncbi:hypothetical protein HMPREF0549_1851 [Limosilactobacillus vaginalis DSM 5837 = ATCC 49540]|uniref:Uncharacterized protein n=1 Tax=Limosilactobacillus vaginalis DSM 5837 = ATCC 49540 TaxID=1423814 RepID=C2EWL5_9LACO|nr:hypothetical protein HMPREF0549_1851 [Limosilactobacillus vaginalis DSM 5837 = ATCC 49540]
MLLLPLEALRLADNDSEALALIESLIDSLELSDSLALILKLRDARLSFEVEVEAVIELLVEVFELELLPVEVL